ncbi:Dyp-type peroxidase [Streptomyces sp. NPDC006235]|uniref:Dyp-type peroxidase n=1 Tax=Streptomyces sp. NPDC006235 TaxID=3156736 RepID=UPI0033BEBAA9
MTTRRRLLTTSAAMAAGAGGLTAVGATVMRNGSPELQEKAPAHLRGAAPLPYAQFVCLDLALGSERTDTLRAAHQAIMAIDGGSVAAWLALGEGAFPSRADKPSQLREMPSFAGDVLDPVQSHGDLLLHITGSSARAVRQAAEQALRALPQQQVRWRMDGTRPENRTEDGRGLSRNPFHFTEGHGNPATAAETTERATIKSGQGEPSWAIGGSYQVIRIIRLATDFWDRDTLDEQERITGRRRNGRWLDGTPSTERAVFTTDPHGKITPLDAHVRRAAPNPRTPPPMVRRSYNYHRAPDGQGLIFCCFQSDLEKGFEAVQRRLQGEAMAKYTLTTGGGYFFVPPPGDSWLDALTKS